jgi:alanyl aminopeptidase
MFEEWIDRERGQGTFLRGVTAYLNEHRHGTGTTADFLASISQAAGSDVAGPFSTFLDQPGVPLVSMRCTDQSGRAGVDVSVERFVPIGSTSSAAARFALPVCVRSLESTQTPHTTCQLIDGAGRIDLQRDRCPSAWHGNADGAGYYRFTAPGPTMTAMAGALSTMTSGERLSFAQALMSSFARASVPFDELLTAALPLANDDELSVAVTPFKLLRFARDHIVEPAARTRVDARITRAYRPAFDRLGFTDKSDDAPRDRERRATIASILALSDPAFARRLSDLGRRWLDERRISAGASEPTHAAGTPHDAAPFLAKDLIPKALSAIVLVDVTDDARFSALLAQAKAERDPQVRGYILSALGSTLEPSLHRRAADLLIDDELRVNEKTMALWLQGGQPQTSRAMFTTLQARYDEFAGELPEEWRPYFPAAAGGLCADADADAVAAFFGPKVSVTPGLDRSLAQTVEEIRLCAARVRAHTERATAALR